MTKYTYILGLASGGLMEDPEWHISKVFTIHANNLKDAKNEWASITGENKKETWSKESQTVWGWSIVCLNSNDPNAVILRIGNEYTDLYNSNDEESKKYIKENAILIVPDNMGRFYDGANTISHLTGIDKDRITTIVDPNFNYKNIKLRIYNNVKENAEAKFEYDKLQINEKSTISNIKEYAENATACIENLNSLVGKLNENLNKEENQDNDLIAKKNLKDERTQIILSMKCNIGNL